MSAEVFLARQPLVDADRAVFGYELLYRGGPDSVSTFDDPDAATRGVMERVLLQWGMAPVVGDRFGLINADASLVVRGLHHAMPPEGMIIEMREPEGFDEATVEALQQARYDGYHFALDNVGRLGDLERSQLLPLASIAKIELTTAHEAEIPRLIEVARERCPGVLVVAEKVETVDDFKRCVDHGFDLFQGYYIAKPEVLRRPARPASRKSAAALRAALVENNFEIDAERVREIIIGDPALAFRLLAALNANAFGLDRSVHSLEQAMALLGACMLRCFAELIATSHEVTDDLDHIDRGAVRAIMAAQLLAGTDNIDSAVTVALLSTTNSLYGAPMGELLDELPMTEEIHSALLHGRGTLGSTLDIIRACERDDPTMLDDLAPGRGDELRALHRTAVDAVASRADDVSMSPMPR